MRIEAPNIDQPWDASRCLDQIATTKEQSAWRFRDRRKSPTDIADTLEEWFVEGAADGYNILPAYFPGAFADFVDLVVPELKHRGLLRRDYEGQTLRDHLGLPRAAAPARLLQAAGAE